MEYNILKDTSLRFKNSAEKDEKFDAFIEQASSAIKGFISFRIQNADDVPDLVQDTFLRAFRFREGFRGDCAPMTWLTMIAFNIVRDRGRKDKTRCKYLTDSVDDPAFFQKGSDGVTEKKREFVDEKCKITVEQTDYVDKLLKKAKLSEEQKLLLDLKEVEGYSVEEMADMLKMNENTLKVKFFRVRQKLVDASRRLNQLPLPDFTPIIVAAATPDSDKQTVSPEQPAHEIEGEILPVARELSYRQYAVFRLLDKGVRQKDIASSLDITPGTVSFHVGNVRKNFSDPENLNKAMEAAAMKYGEVESQPKMQPSRPTKVAMPPLSTQGCAYAS